MHKPSKLMSIVECYQACHAFVTRASEIVDILNAMNHRASKCQMMAATTLRKYIINLQYFMRYNSTTYKLHLEL